VNYQSNRYFEGRVGHEDTKYLIKMVNQSDIADSLSISVNYMYLVSILFVMLLITLEISVVDLLGIGLKKRSLKGVNKMNL